MPSILDYLSPKEQGPSYSKYASSIMGLPPDQQTNKNALDIAIQAGFPRPAEAADAVMKSIDADRKRLKENQPTGTVPLDLPLAQTLNDITAGKLNYLQPTPMSAPLGYKDNLPMTLQDLAPLLPPNAMNVNNLPSPIQKQQPELSLFGPGALSELPQQISQPYIPSEILTKYLGAPANKERKIVQIPEGDQIVTYATNPISGLPEIRLGQAPKQILNPREQAFAGLTPEEQKQTILRENGAMNEFQTFKEGYLKSHSTATNEEVVSEYKKLGQNQDQGLNELRSFEAETGTDPTLRGTEPYQKAIMDWRRQKATETKININMPTPDQAKSMVGLLVNGQVAPSLLFGRGQAARNVLYAEVANEYPKFDINKAEANYKYMTNPNNLRTIGLVSALIDPGSQGISRIDMLRQKIDNLANTNPQLINKSLNFIKTQTGNPAVVDYESLRNAIVAEANTALSGTSVPSDFRIKLELENLGSENSPAQIKASLNNLLSALIARQDASQAVPYPWDVVRGEKTMEQAMKELRGNKTVKGVPVNPKLKNMTNDELLKELLK